MDIVFRNLIRHWTNGIFNNWALYRNTTFFCELQRIRLQVKNYLLDSGHVGDDVWAKGHVTIDKFVINIQVLHFEFDSLLAGFLALDVYDLVNGFFYIKFLDIFTKFTRSYLCEIE